jgi:hypothetical protein
MSHSHPNHPLSTNRISLLRYSKGIQQITKVNRKLSDGVYIAVIKRGSSSLSSSGVRPRLCLMVATPSSKEKLIDRADVRVPAHWCCKEHVDFIYDSRKNLSFHKRRKYIHMSTSSDKRQGRIIKCSGCPEGSKLRTDLKLRYERYNLLSVQSMEVNSIVHKMYLQKERKLGK